MKKRTPEQRLKRGCCPVHGIPMDQISAWLENSKEHFVYVGCPRKDCNWSAKANDYNGPLHDPSENKRGIEDANHLRVWCMLRNKLPEEYNKLINRLRKKGDARSIELLKQMDNERERVQ